MTQLRAFRWTGRAGGVDDDADVIRRDLAQGVQPFPIYVGLVGLPCRLNSVLPRDQARVGVVTHALHVDADDPLEQRQAAVLLARIQNLVDLFLIAADDEAALRVTHDILQLGPGVRRIDTNRHAAERLNRKVGDQPFRRILAGNGQAVAAAEAQTRQCKGEFLHPLFIVRPAAAAPNASDLFPHRHAIRARARAASQQMRQRRTDEFSILRGHCCAAPR